MFKPLNQLNAIFDSILDMNLSGNEQLVLFHLFDAFNRAHWTESLKLSDEMLKWRLNQYDSNGKPITTETIRRAKQKLKGKGLIDFVSGNGGRVTEYKLVKLYKDSPSELPKNTPVNTPEVSLVNTPEGAGLVSYTCAGGQDLKTVRQEDILTTTTTTRAHTREGGEGTGETANSTPEIKVAQEEKVKVSDNVRRRWIQATYANPTELDEEGLAAFEKEFGSEKVFFAIGKANQHKKNPTINLRNVEVVLRGEDKPQNWKEGYRNESRQSNRTATDNDDRFSYRSQYDDL